MIKAIGLIVFLGLIAMGQAWAGSSCCPFSSGKDVEDKAKTEVVAGQE